MSIQPIKTIRKIQPYIPPLDGRRRYKGLLLDFNEKIGQDSDNIYPEYGLLRRTIADYCNVEDNQILVTAGAGSAISLVFRAYCELKDRVVIPSPSFELLFQAARITGAEIISPAFDEVTGDFPLADVLSFNKNPKIIVVCNPNNPTGTLLEVSEIKKIALKFKNSLILVDEAYFEYSNVSAIEAIRNCPNVIVIRTLSKAFGLAALRIGYVVANKGVIATLQKVSNPYDVAMPSVLTAQQALKDSERVKAYANEVMNSSRRIIEDFFTEYAIPFYPSKSNFICFKVRDISNIFDQLAKKDILIRKVDSGSKLRVTLGPVKAAQSFVKTYKEILEQQSIEKVALIDRDGTLIFEPQDTYQIDEIDKLAILPKVEQGLKQLLASGYRLIMVTNQDGLGSPGYPREKFLKVQNALLMRLAQKDIYFDRVFVCPHMPNDNCVCRKPKTMLVSIFFKQYWIDKEQSLVVGDRQTDKDFAKNLGLPVVAMKTNAAFPRINLNRKKET
jgi:histidinol-phosphate aminotransferase